MVQRGQKVYGFLLSLLSHLLCNDFCNVIYSSHWRPRKYHVNEMMNCNRDTDIDHLMWLEATFHLDWWT